MNSKIITLHSPIPKTGQTTLATLLATSIAESGKMVVLVELSKYTGFSVYLNKSFGNNSNSLQECLLNVDKLSSNLSKSKFHKNFYFLCQSYESLAIENLNVNATNLDKLVKRLMETFEYILLDLPSDYNDVFTTAVLSGGLNIPIFNHLEVLNENIECLKRFNEIANAIKNSRSGISDLRTTVVVNQSLKRYSPLYAPHFQKIPFMSIQNIIDIPYMEEYTYLCNEGNLFETGVNERTKSFFNDIELLAKVAVNPEIKGIGNVVVRQVSDIDTRESGAGFFKRRKKESKKEKQVNQVKQEIQEPKERKPKKKLFGNKKNGGE